MARVAVLIAKQSHCTIDDIKQCMKFDFKSMDYARGFCDGYFFGSYQFVQPNDLAKAWNENSELFQNNWLIFINVQNYESMTL